MIPERLRVPVPDFRNLGAILRVLGCGNLLMLLTVLIRTPHLREFVYHMTVMVGRAELPLMALSGWLYWLGPWLNRLHWRDLTLITGCMAVALAIIFQTWILPAVDADAYLRGLLWAAGSSVAVMAYFRWRQISQMPALGEARILALTARIRPHFFFNCINGVLGVMRSEPKRAEQALESMAELFRELMRDSRELVQLCDEIELCNRYLELERLRLGDRLNVKWELKHAPLNAQVPPLMLQPLLENAVCHGIEPNPEPGRILVRIIRRGNMLDMRISNPLCPGGGRRAGGNRMALNNIRERLALFFDMEATLSTEEQDGEFRVRVRIPLRKEEK
ncbi:histidine kinase [Uliginosibacterium sp. 31-16]|uniref:sensor histidine kinase n=1 Tax=Uliginosibacterium sp. 31-16 TaxID=3068315 RepID=UPI00273E9263|nr:histidine kinase [Uliginosibacterium sp. 31-16]MDP5239216.1 histidine kinase [Uliginosibacterium sp. 31-16]